MIDYGSRSILCWSSKHERRALSTWIAYCTAAEEATSRLSQAQESWKGSGRLRGKLAVITGGDSGIGRAVAIAYAREGADVALIYLEETEDAGQVLAAASLDRCGNPLDLTVDSENVVHACAAAAYSRAC